MSHTSSIGSVKITDLTSLQNAIDELVAKGIKMRLVRNATPRAFYANQQGMGPADMVIVLDDAPYDIGLYKTEDGAYEARTDFWGGHVERVLGGKATNDSRRDQAKLGRLFQSYGVHATMQAARRRGQQARRIDHADGSVTLEITGNNL